MSLKIISFTKLRTQNYRYLSASSNSKSLYDVLVIGGGIVGTASARHIQNKYPKSKVGLVEKESKLAAHQSGHNSGVIHAGIYYKPGSLKAKLCVKGLHLMYKYLKENNVPYEKCGKLIVATRQDEIEKLRDLYKRAQQNNVPDCTIMGPDEMKKIEPACTGIKAIHSPYTGIVDFAVVTNHFAKDFQNSGGIIHLNFKVSKFSAGGNPDYPVSITASDGRVVQAKYVLACAGLYSDTIAQLSGGARDPAIIPIRGEYLMLKKGFEHMIKGNIYPVPNPKLPFLGVHFTKRIDGSVWLGPNAIVAFRKEGYRWSDIHIGELYSTITYPGFLKIILKYPVFGLSEVIKSVFVRYQVNDLTRFVPDIKRNQVIRGPSGVRAQAMSLTGELIEDFHFETGDGIPGKFILHCRNAPSPGATSSLAIAEMIAEKFDELFHISKIHS